LPMQATNWLIEGVTRDRAGAVLSNCQVLVFRTVDNVLVGSSQSNANGEYSIAVPTQGAHYVVAYLAGTPDVAGTTANTVTGI
jgi:hypothetical protein